MEAVEFGTFVNNGMIEIPAEYQKDYYADFIVTRNAGDFTKSPVPAISPADFLKR
jgi:hypothetical protein